jgi:hypothetical protein
VGNRVNQHNLLIRLSILAVIGAAVSRAILTAQAKQESSRRYGLST